MEIPDDLQIHVLEQEFKLSTKEVARILGLGTYTVSNWRRRRRATPGAIRVLKRWAAETRAGQPPDKILDRIDMTPDWRR